MTIGSFISYTIEKWAQLNFFDLAAPLIIYSFLLVIYAIFVWHFYKSVSKRDLFRLDFRRRHAWRSSAVYVLKYVILFPLFTFLWFVAMAAVLFLLSKTQTTNNILLISMAIIIATRVSAYYKEGMAEEISKILPLGVLAIFIVDPTYFSFSVATERLTELPSFAPALINYFLFTVVMEFVLHALFMIKRALVDGDGRPKPRKQTQKQPTAQKQVTNPKKVQ